MSPFEMYLGWNPKSPIDMLARNDCPVETVTEFKSRLNETLSDAKFSYQVSKSRQSAQRGKSYKAYSYKVGDRLWINRMLFKDSYLKSQQSDKLSGKRFSPFFVKKLVGKNAAKVELPCHLKIHDVVHVFHTKSYHEQASDFSAPVKKSPDPIPAVGGEEYIVELILNHRKRGKGVSISSCLMKGSPTRDAEWQPSRELHWVIAFSLARTSIRKRGV